VCQQGTHAREVGALSRNHRRRVARAVSSRHPTRSTGCRARLLRQVSTDLPTATAAPPAVTNGARETRAPSRRPVTTVVVLVGIALAIVFWLVSGGRTPTTKLSINGRPVWVDGTRPSLANALDAGRVQPRDGVLLSAVTKKVIDAHAAPAEVLVDGTKVALAQRLTA